MKTTMRMFLAGLAVLAILTAGCEGRFDSASGPSPSGRSAVTDIGGGRTTDTLGCATATGILLPNATLTLSTLNSEVKYDNNSVLVPTTVSFSICELDTTGTPLIPRAFIFGALPDVAFLKIAKVKIESGDAGLPDLPGDIDYFLFRRNDLTGAWELQQQLKTGKRKLEYNIRRNGVYAVAFDTSWVSSAIIGPGGGDVSVRTAVIRFPAGALPDTATISFRLSLGTPAGLPGALNRVYEFGPEGIVFQAPVTLFVPFLEAGITDDKVYPTKFYYHDESTDTWVPQPTLIDWEHQRFVVSLHHFSRYAFAR